MALLSESLLSVVDALLASVSQAIATHYRQKLQAHTHALDALQQSPQIACSGPALLACTASQLLFGDRAVTADDPGYRKLQQVIW